MKERQVKQVTHAAFNPSHFQALRSRAASFSLHCFCNCLVVIRQQKVLPEMCKTRQLAQQTVKFEPGNGAKQHVLAKAPGNLNSQLHALKKPEDVPLKGF